MQNTLRWSNATNPNRNKGYEKDKKVERALVGRRNHKKRIMTMTKLRSDEANVSGLRRHAAEE